MVEVMLMADVKKLGKAGAIEANRGVKLTRSQLSLPDQLKEVGSYDAKIDLGEGVSVPFKVQIVEEAAE